MPKTKSKSKAKPKKSKAVEASPPDFRKSVDIKRANNGFVVSSYDGMKEKVFIAKSKGEAQGFANKLLGFNGKKK